MAGSVRTCPSCKSLLLKETAQCPECGHVIDAQRQAQQARQPSGQTRPTSPNEIPCPGCGERVKPGLVRCWNCGSFMREDIAAKYQEMQASPSPVIYSDSVDDDDSPVYQFHESAGDDDDFQLSSDVTEQVTPPEDAGDFETSPEFSPQAPGEAGSSGEYQLSGSEAESGAPARAEETESEPPENKGRTGQQEAGEEKEPTAHSIATGGDALFQVAMEEETETAKRRTRPGKIRRAITGFLVYCPNGHRIEVHDRHRGKLGRCPRCRAAFLVPEKTPEELGQEQQAAEGGEETGDQSGVVTAGAYKHWMADVPLHTVNPEKLRLKAGSLRNEFEEVDFGFSPEGLLVARLSSSSGVFGIGGKKKDEAREELLAALREEVPFEDLPTASKHLYDVESLESLIIAQPIIYEHESMFAGVPVFGKGRIAVRFPKNEQSEFPQFASFSLSEFREFARILNEMYGIEDFGDEQQVPLEDSFTEHACHYSEETFHALEHVEFYEADPTYKLKVVGRKCQGCGLIVSEDARKKEKIGGASGRGLSRAKCPKCGQKFGEFTFYAIQEGPATPPTEPDDQQTDTGQQHDQPEPETASAESK